MYSRWETTSPSGDEVFDSLLLPTVLLDCNGALKQRVCGAKSSRKGTAEMVQFVPNAVLVDTVLLSDAILVDNVLLSDAVLVDTVRRL